VRLTGENSRQKQELEKLAAHLENLNLKQQSTEREKNFLQSQKQDLKHEIRTVRENKNIDFKKMNLMQVENKKLQALVRKEGEQVS